MANFIDLKSMGSSYDMACAIADVMPANLGICRIHVAGDFFNQKYFRAWQYVAEWNPDRLFYAYTKSLNYWLDDLEPFATKKLGIDGIAWWSLGSQNRRA